MVTQMVLDDNPTVDDRFGFKTYAQNLADIIASVKVTPFTVGLLGTWGCGKTTLMMMVEKILKEKLYKTIWFNPWKYDNKEAVWNALIQSILLEIKNDTQDNSLVNKISECSKMLAWYAIRVGANKLTSGILNDKFIQELKGVFDTDEQSYEFINKFETKFEELVDTYSPNKKLLICVDDLDRCIPENAITILESMKLYLGKANCVFILGLEKGIVEKGIRLRYKAEIDYSGKDYLEKIIQLPFVLPAVGEKAIRDFISCPDCPSILPSKEYRNKFIKVIHAGTGGNIRKLKRFINTYAFLKKVGNIQEDDGLRQELLAKLIIIQTQFPTFYKTLKSDPEALSQAMTSVEHNEQLELTSGDEGEEEVNMLQNFIKVTKGSENPGWLVSQCLSITDMVK